MNLNITKTLNLSNAQVKDIIIKYLHRYYNISGIFDIKFMIENNQLSNTKVNISENDSSEMYHIDNAE